MKKITTLAVAMLTVVSAYAYRYDFTFNNTPISQALVKVARENSDVNISFIYKELDNYRTSARIRTDNAYDAIHKIIGLNPISVIRKGDNIYVEALQHGKFSYSGTLMGSDHEPVAAATVMLLAPGDSTVVTYGITDADGRFSIPCDRRGVIGKLSCMGYKTTYRPFNSFNLGTITMEELPIKLKAVTVEGDYATIYSDKTVYRPNQRQKNSSQTATDLLSRMAIPQLYVPLGSTSVSTVGGEPVAMYIDGVPATADELKMMRMADVRTVEYLDFPSDPRFQGHPHVINFRMVRYEYGGYAKVLGTENFIVNTGNAQANVRLVRKNMTYDLMGYAYYSANDHTGAYQTETFRLPETNGGDRIFDRVSETESSKYRRQNYETSFRALYSSEKATANSQVSFGLERMPADDASGHVAYTSNAYTSSSYNSLSDSRANYFRYKGFYFFALPKSNSLTVNANYSHSHTNQASSYSESGMASILNAAKDNTNAANARLAWGHDFGNRHSLQIHSYGLYEHNRTNYSGTLSALDLSKTGYLQIGATYNLNLTKFSGSASFGWSWLHTKLNEVGADSNYPYVDLSLQYQFNKKNYLNGVFHYSVWPPSSNYKSENMIQVSPFLWHTGNPRLKSHRSYDIGLFYTFIPSNRFNLSAFASAWLVGNRDAFVYEPYEDGILRTIRQPIGHFSHYNYGINASSNFMDGNLQLSGRLEHLIVRNGEPFNVNHSVISYYLQAIYYLKQFNFAIAYTSPTGSDNYNSMSGIWTKKRGTFVIQAGWSNSSWNLRLTAQNLQRWHWRTTTDSMNSEFYSFSRQNLGIDSHAFVQLSATYTFGYGKKVQAGNDHSKQSGTSSGILK